MKTSCGVIRDLLPLYAEKMTGEESDALVREHLAECRDCSEYLEKLQNPANDKDIAVTSSGNSLRLVRRGIRKRKVTAVLFYALLVFTVMLTAFSHIVKPCYISYQNSGITVTEAENGDIYARFSDGVTSCSLKKSTGADNRSEVEIIAWTSLWDKILGKTTPSVLISSKTEKADVAYFCDLSTENGYMSVIYGTDTANDVSTLPRLSLGYYFIAALVAAVLCGIAFIIFRKNRNISRVCGYLFAAPLSYVLGHLIITTSFTSFSQVNDLILNCIAAASIYGILISGNSLIGQYKKDSFTEE